MGLSEPIQGTVCLATGKAIFTKSQAKSAAKRDQRRNGLNITAYRCWHCKCWHVGRRGAQR